MNKSLLLEHDDLKEDMFDRESCAERLKIRSASDRRLKNYRKRTSLFTPSCDTKEGSKKGRTSVRRTRSAPVEGKDDFFANINVSTTMFHRSSKT